MFLRYCTTGEGRFQFYTQQSRVIHSKVHAMATQKARRSSEVSSGSVAPVKGEGEGEEERGREGKRERGRGRERGREKEGERERGREGEEERGRGGERKRKRVEA